MNKSPFVRLRLPASPQTELRFAPESAALSTEQLRLIARLAELDVDSLTPRAALDLLYELARRAKTPS